MPENTHTLKYTNSEPNLDPPDQPEKDFWKDIRDQVALYYGIDAGDITTLRDGFTIPNNS